MAQGRYGYRIIRFYLADKPRRTVRTGLTLEEAQEWCRRPEASSSTELTVSRRTREHGKWFDGFERDRVR